LGTLDSIEGELWSDGQSGDKPRFAAAFEAIGAALSAPWHHGAGPEAADTRGFPGGRLPGGACCAGSFGASFASMKAKAKAMPPVDPLNFERIDLPEIEPIDDWLAKALAEMAAADAAFQAELARGAFDPFEFELFDVDAPLPPRRAPRLRKPRPPRCGLLLPNVSSRQMHLPTKKGRQDRARTASAGLGVPKSRAGGLSPCPEGTRAPVGSGEVFYDRELVQPREGNRNVSGVSRVYGSAGHGEEPGE
jgi:hypothetical protein